MTCRTSKPSRYFSVRRRTSRQMNVRKLPMCPRAYTVRPQVYIRTVLSTLGAKSSSRRVNVLKRRIALRERSRGAPCGSVVVRDRDRQLAVVGFEGHVAPMAAALHTLGERAAQLVAD